jgi:hypothetical protein
MALPDHHRPFASSLELFRYHRRRRHTTAPHCGQHLQAAANALALADELQGLPHDIPAAPARYEPDQVALGKGYGLAITCCSTEPIARVG